MEELLINTNIFTNKGGNTLIREFEGILEHNQQIKYLDAVVGFFRASGYFSLRPFLNNINKARVLIGIDVDKKRISLTIKNVTEEDLENKITT